MPATLVMLKGHPGSGKSTLGRALAQRFGCALVDKDDAKDCLTVLRNCSEAEVNAVSYDIMFKVASTQLSLGLSVVLDCPLARRQLFDRGAMLAEQFGARLVLVECEAVDLQMWRARLESRVAGDVGGVQGHKPQSWDALQRVIQAYGSADRWTERMDEELRQDYVRIDTSTGSTMDHVHTVEKLLEQSGA